MSTALCTSSTTSIEFHGDLIGMVGFEDQLITASRQGSIQEVNGDKFTEIIKTDYWFTALAIIPPKAALILGTNEAELVHYDLTTKTITTKKLAENYQDIANIKILKVCQSSTTYVLAALKNSVIWLKLSDSNPPTLEIKNRVTISKESTIRAIETYNNYPTQFLVGCGQHLYHLKLEETKDTFTETVVKIAEFSFDITALACNGSDIYVASKDLRVLQTKLEKDKINVLKNKSLFSKIYPWSLFIYKTNLFFLSGFEVWQIPFDFKKEKTKEPGFWQKKEHVVFRPNKTLTHFRVSQRTNSDELMLHAISSSIGSPTSHFIAAPLVETQSNPQIIKAKGTKPKYDVSNLSDDDDCIIS